MKLKSLLVLLSILPLLALGDFPQDPCQSNHLICKATEDNVIEIISEVDTIEECRDLCHNSYPNCNFFNHFGRRSFPFTNTCMILDSCEEIEFFNDDCHSEEAYCNHRSCGSEVEGQIGNNLIEHIPSVQSEKSCKIICANTEGCTYYTYYEETHDSFPKSCFLLSTFDFPVKRCQDCITSPVSCNDGICGFYEGENVTASAKVFEFKGYGKYYRVTVLMLGRCNPLKALAMGPGGEYSGRFDEEWGCYEVGGGGSGYLNFTFLPLNGLVELEMSCYKSTNIREKGSNYSFLEASVGGGGIVDHISTRAGDGYSGGGGRGRTCIGYSDQFGGDGGCNGTSGTYGQPGSKPGIGSGFQVGSLPFEMLSVR